MSSQSNVQKTLDEILATHMPIDFNHEIDKANIKEAVEALIVSETTNARVEENQNWLRRINAGEFGSWVFGGAITSMRQKLTRRIATLTQEKNK
jgi:hypothetical protein